MQKCELISLKQDPRLKGKPSEVLRLLMEYASELVNNVLRKLYPLSTDVFATTSRLNYLVDTPKLGNQLKYIERRYKEIITKSLKSLDKEQYFSFVSHLHVHL